MKKTVFTFIFLWFIPCIAKFQIPHYEYYSNEIIHNFAEQMKEELGLFCCGNSGKMSTDVERIGLRFNTSCRVNLDEARALTVFVTEKFVNAINSHEKIRPYLHEYPFPSSRVNISIFFNNLMGDLNSDGSICYVFHHGSWIVYSVRDAFEDELVELLEEPYDKAAKKVEASAIRIPLRHETTPLESSIDDIFYMYCQEMAEKYGLYVWGIGCKKSDALEEIGARFTVFKPASQEQARAIQVIAIERLLELVNTHEILRPYLTEYPFTSEKIKMRLNFRNKKYTKYRDGSMESVTLEGNKVTYLRKPEWKKGDPISKLNAPIILVGQETYQEAKQKVLK